MIIRSGQCVTLSFQLRTRGGSLIDVTNDPNTAFVSQGGLGSFLFPNVFCTTAAPGQQFLLLGQHRTSTGALLTGRVVIKVGS